MVDFNESLGYYVSYYESIERCGERTLIKLCDVINTYPKMLRRFYALRLDNEGIVYHYDGEGNLVLTK